MAAAIRALGKSVFVAKGITFIFRSQATILWWALEQRPTNPQGVTFSLDNLNRNARWLHDYLNIMRWDDPAEFLVDAAGLGVGGGLRLGGAAFPKALAGAVGARQFVKWLFGVETKTLFGIIPKPFVRAADTVTGVVEGGTALVLEGIGIAGGLAQAVSTGNILGTISSLRELKGFIDRSVAFVNESIENLGGVVTELTGLGKDIMETAAYYGGIVNQILTFGLPQPVAPREFERFIFRTPDEILADLLGPVGDVGSRFVPGDVRPPTISEQLTVPAREAVGRARERVAAKEAAMLPTRLTIEAATEIARVGVAFQQERLQMSLGMVGRSRDLTDIGLLELLREVKKGR